MDPTNPEYQWYQTDAAVFVSIMKRAVDASTVHVDFTEDTVDIFVKEQLLRNFHLANKIIPSKCSYKVLSVKIELKLAKIVSNSWNCLEGEDKRASLKVISIPSTDTTTDQAGDKPKANPAKSSTNWDAVAKEADEIEEGDPLNNLFQKIFKDANEDTRRAMMKSFTESGGTVLSTNWDDVGKGKVDMKPPDGMEYKEYPR